MRKSKKLSELKQTNGELAEKVVPQTIDQLLGYNGKSKYKFLHDPFDDVEYEQYLKGLNESDLYNHCLEFGIMHMDNKKLTISKLLNEFRVNRSMYSLKSSNNPNEKPLNTSQEEEVRRIMAAGR